MWWTLLTFHWFNRFSYQDQQKGCPGCPCFSPGGTWGLSLPACVSWPVDSQPSHLPLMASPQNQHVFCCQHIIKKMCTKWREQRQKRFSSKVWKTNRVSLFSATEFISSFRLLPLLGVIRTGWRIAWINLPKLKKGENMNRRYIWKKRFCCLYTTWNIPTCMLSLKAAFWILKMRCRLNFSSVLESRLRMLFEEHLIP